MGFEIKEERERREGGNTRVSPLSLVILAGRPAGRACWKTGRSPARAALNMRVAKSIISGVRGGLPFAAEEGGRVVIVVVDGVGSGSRGIGILTWFRRQLRIIKLEDHMERRDWVTKERSGAERNDVFQRRDLKQSL